MKVSDVWRYVGLAVLGGTVGALVCLVLMGISFSVTPSGGPDSPRPMELPSASEWSMIATIAGTFGVLVGSVLGPVGYWLMRPRLSVGRMASLAAVVSLALGALGAFAGPWTAALMAIGGFLTVAIVVRLLPANRPRQRQM